MAKSSISGVGTLGDGLAVAGSIAYMATGDSRAAAAAKWGTVIGGSIGGTVQVAEGISTLLKGTSQFSRLGRFTGGLAIVTGGISMGMGIASMVTSLKNGKWTTQTTTGLLDATSGALAVAGGICMMIPGAQPIGGILLGASGILCAASVIVGNWGSIKAGVKKFSSWAQNAAKKTFSWTKNTAKKAFSWTKNTAKKTFSWTKNATKKVKNVFKKLKFW